MKDLIKHVTDDELRKLIKKEKDKYVHERLLFIHLLYLDYNVETACNIMCIAVQSGYNWLALWNQKGREGLSPNFAGGTPAKLTNEQTEQLKDSLKSKGNWLTQEVRSLIKKDFGITYSLRHISRTLRGFGMNYAKPYSLDYRKPANAEALLIQSIKDAVNGLPSDTVIGFMDEAAPQTADNRQRFWSFGKPTKTKNTTKYRANTFGFYPINGKSALEFYENSKVPSVRGFLREIKDKNPGKHTVVFWDNAPQHKAAETRRFAERIGISLVFLPKYSPDLDPIEFIWKSVRRRISQISFIGSEWSFKESIRATFHRLAKGKSFMANWLEKFQPYFSNLLCP